jgi:dipeptidyl aminopeptidase/acylaminoacyl peptidase
MKNILLFLIICCPILIVAQIPNTNIYLLDVNYMESINKFTFTNATKINTSNTYNNQPYFLPDGNSLLFTSIGMDKQADIYKYDLKNKITTRLTSTNHVKEYSPQLTPDKNHISVVRVEEDDSTQHLWQYSLNGMPEKMLSKLNPIGYYCWLNNNEVALDVLQKGDKMNIELLNLTTAKTKKIAENTGRCMLSFKINDSIPILYYVQKKAADSTYLAMAISLIKLKNYTDIKPSPFLTLPFVEDFCWMKDFGFLIGKNGKLYLNNDKKYNLIADFSNTNYASFYRLAYYPISATKGKLALVVYANKK